MEHDIVLRGMVSRRGRINVADLRPVPVYYIDILMHCTAASRGKLKLIRSKFDTDRKFASRTLDKWTYLEHIATDTI